MKSKKKQKIKLTIPMWIVTLIIKIKLFYINRIKPNAVKLALSGAAAFIVVVGLAVGYNRYEDAKRYYYIDLDGNKGVAVECHEFENGLVCKKEYNGKVLVKQYWQGN